MDQKTKLLIVALIVLAILIPVAIIFLFPISRSTLPLSPSPLKRELQLPKDDRGKTKLVPPVTIPVGTPTPSPQP